MDGASAELSGGVRKSVTYDSARASDSPVIVLRALWDRRELAMVLARRDIRARYQQALLGTYWTIVNPLATAAVMTIVFSVVIKVPTNGMPYPVFVLCGLVGWNYFANAVTNSTVSLVGLANLLTKVAFPREILPFASVLARLVDVVVSVVIVLVVMALYGMAPHWTLLFVPVIILIETIFTLGVGLLLSAANLFFRDVSQLLGVLLSLWMFLTPVIYPASSIPPSLQWIFFLNPLTPLVDGLRNVIAVGRRPDGASLGEAAIISIVFFIVGYAAFKKFEPLFAEAV